MRTVFCFLLLAASAQAQTVLLVADGRGEFPYDTLTSDYAWELRTPGGQFVRAEWNDVPNYRSELFAVSRSRRIDAANAPTFGVDWVAWHTAVSDPTYTIMRFIRNDVADDILFPSAFTAPNRAGFTLDNFTLNIGYPGLPQVGPPVGLLVTMGAGFRDESVVPEPASLLMLFAGLLHVMGCRSTAPR